jgi:hypothetical protein
LSIVTNSVWPNWSWRQQYQIIDPIGRLIHDRFYSNSFLPQLIEVKTSVLQML